jgi:adenine/guanine/hypoxanthine permease
LTGDRIVPANLDAKEPWVVPPGGIIPIWIQKLTGRYVDPCIEYEMENHDAMSVATDSHDHIKRSEHEK